MNKPILFKNITVVTPDDTGVAVIPSCYVLVIDGRYKYIGTSYKDVLNHVFHNDFDIYDGTNRILLPAFANAHTHLAMTLMRNQADDTTLHKWLYDVIFPLEANLRPQDLNSGTILGIAEMIKNGIGACANMYMTHESAMDSQAAIDSGIKMNTVIDSGHKDKSTGKYILDKAVFDNIFDKFDKAGNGNILCGVLVHSIYLYNEEYYYELAGLAKSKNTFIHVHVSETEKEVDDCFARYKMSPPAILEKMGIFDVPAIAAHCVFLDDNDRDIFKRNNVTVVHNPTSNLKLGSGIADLKKMLDSSINVALGTDGPASNNSLDIYQEMKLASLLAKGVNHDAAIIPAGEMLRMATINGMNGMGFKNSGRVSVGYDADLQIINTQTPSMTPLGNPVSALVYSTNAGCVESLMVSGKMLMKNKELLTIDEEKAIFEAKKSSNFLNR
ncbi:MAG: amidohydrolase family protein [Saccharofermentanales bacterium]